MPRTIEFDRIIRGTEVTIYATDFDGDESVGISYGPETIYALDMNGNDFELTEEEVEKFTIEASKIADEDCDE